MTNKNGQKGTAWETAIVLLMRATHWPNAMRRPKEGRLDKGDLHGPAGWTLEAKNHGRIDLPDFMRQAREEAGNNGHSWYAVIQKARRGKNCSGRTEDAYFVVPLELGIELMRLQELHASNCHSEGI